MKEDVPGRAGADEPSAQRRGPGSVRDGGGAVSLLDQLARSYQGGIGGEIRAFRGKPGSGMSCFPPEAGADG